MALLHVSEIAEHRVKEVKDELREGDQILVKVLSIEGNRIKLSRKAVLREQRAKLGLPEVPQGGSEYGEPAQRPSIAASQTVEENVSDDDDEDDDEEGDDEPNFNRAEPEVAVPGGAPVRPQGGPSGSGERKPGGNDRRRRRGGRRPGGGSGGGAPQGGGNRQS